MSQKFSRKNLRFELSRRMMDSSLANAYMRNRLPYQHTRYIPRCDVVVDGFPRSANTYIWYALKTVLEPKYMVRGHTHSVATIKAGVRDGKPTMLVIREPDAVVASLYQLLDGVPLETCFRAYTRFHDQCLHIKDETYIAKFEDVTSDFGQVLDSFYRQYDLDWPGYVKNPDNEGRVSDAIEYANKRRNNGQIREAGIARPSSNRMSASEVLNGMSPQAISERSRAEESYKKLIDGLD